MNMLVMYSNNMWVKNLEDEEEWIIMMVYRFWSFGVIKANWLQYAEALVTRHLHANS